MIGRVVLAGIEILDCGHKVGLKGVDNGAVWFHSVRVPRTAILNKFADVGPDGKYTSSIASSGTFTPPTYHSFPAVVGETRCLLMDRSSNVGSRYLWFFVTHASQNARGCGMVGKRFAATLSALVTGRLAIVGGSITIMRIALITAIRYAHVRRQFGPPGGAEVTLMEYTTHSYRLMPLLAQFVALDFARRYVHQRYASTSRGCASLKGRD